MYPSSSHGESEQKRNKVMDIVPSPLVQRDKSRHDGLLFRVLGNSTAMPGHPMEKIKKILSPIRAMNPYIP